MLARFACIDRTAVALLLLIGMAGVPGHAQEPDARRFHGVELSIGGGLLLSTEWSDLVALGNDRIGGGFAEQLLLRDLAVDPGPVLDASVTYWRGRVGLRIRGAYSPSCLSVGAGGCIEDGLAPGERVRLGLGGGDSDLNVFLYNLEGMIRTREPEPGQDVRPFISFGFGGVTYDARDGVRKVLPRFVEFGGRAGRLTRGDDGQVVLVEKNADDGPFLLAVDEVGLETVFAAVLGIGADLRIAGDGSGAALRFEFTDHIVSSPLDVRLAAIRNEFGDDFFDFGDETSEIEFDFGRVHNLRFHGALVITF